MKRSFEEYVNLHRSLDLMIAGPIEGIYNTADLIKEAELILDKKSRLSRKNRDRIQRIYELAKTNYESDISDPAEETPKYDKLEQLMTTSKALATSMSALKCVPEVYK